MPTELVERLSEAATKKSFDPIKDIDWEEPFDLERFYMPEQDLSLYDTPIYVTLSHQARIRLSLHEAASAMATGIWFENILKHKFLDYLYDGDPHEPNFRFMLHEVADECHHSTMFGEFIRRSGAPFYPVRWWAKWGGHIMKEAVPKASVFIGILAAEELMDYFNRSAMNNPDVHPTVRRISQIHVIEEARHISYARNYLANDFPRLGGLMRARVLVGAPIIAAVIVSQIISPEVYKTLGLPEDSHRCALDSPHRKRLLQAAGEKFMAFLQEIGVVTAYTRPAWKMTRLHA
jgi:para-aminobenzoate N-oxygenase AurF